MTINGLWIIFSLSFVTALSGALSPGPLLTYTIMKSMKDKKWGYLSGFLVITGHAILESAILITIILGFSPLLKNSVFIRVISIIGCIFLLFFGVSIFISVLKGKVSTDFLETDPGKTALNPKLKAKGINHPILGGILVSMSNPYWWIWWATIGGTFLVQFDISISSADKLLAFFLGHEAGDLVWYAPVSILVHFGRRKLNKTVYSVILMLCSIFMAGFGLYLGIRPFFN